jgi:hypothetical protein
MCVEGRSQAPAGPGRVPRVAASDAAGEQPDAERQRHDAAGDVGDALRLARARIDVDSVRRADDDRPEGDREREAGDDVRPHEPAPTVV